MLRKMFQGGSSKKQGPIIAMRDADEDPPRDAPVRPCEWPSENFMDRAGIKEELREDEYSNLLTNELVRS